MELTIAFIIGAIIGGIVMWYSGRVEKVGTLKIDSSDPYDGPYMFLELDKDIRTVRRMKRVSLDVDITSYMSHK